MLFAVALRFFYFIDMLQAFRPGNVDLPSTASHVANPAALTLPDTITELDLFAPMPDLDELLQEDIRAPGQDPTLLDWGTSQVLPHSMDVRQAEETLQLEDDDLGIDLGEDIASPGEDRSIEIGRRAESARPDMRDESMLFGDDLGIDLGLDEPTIVLDEPSMPIQDEPQGAFDDDIDMGGMTGLGDLGIEESNISALERAGRQRDSASPLSDIDEDVARDAEQEYERSFAMQPAEEDDETMVQAQQRAKRRKVLQADVNTELANSQIKAQQEDRSKILKAPTFLPRDPVLLALMEMQKNGGFVSNILGNGRSLGWAPELRGVLSLEVVRTAGELKRKRDSGIPDIVIPQEEEAEEELPVEGAAGLTSPPEMEQEDFPNMGGDDFAPAFAEDIAPALGRSSSPMEAASPGPAFDETTMPILHPAESGPVSLGTKHAVHILRERFSTEDGEEPSEEERSQQSVLFTDICPRSRTSKQDATKLFFEMLVLGTKDAIKVDQSSDEIGGPIRIRGKRGLWGDWAEMGASGGLESQTQRTGADPVAAAA